MTPTPSECIEELATQLQADYAYGDSARDDLHRLAAWALRVDPDSVRGIVARAIARAEYPDRDRCHEALLGAAGSMILASPEEAAGAVVACARLDGEWGGGYTLDAWVDAVDAATGEGDYRD